jgi:S-adenosylmethionine hydrolase
MASANPPPPVITFLSDYGHRDEFVGVCHGVSADGRRAVALRTAEQDRLLVGPDNGLLMPAAERLAGAVEAVDIGDSPECLRPVSRTFHGSARPSR